MADTQTRKGSEYNQTSFSGGMNLLGDDSRLAPNEYRIGFDLTNRNDVLDNLLESQKDVSLPVGIKQEIRTFGEFIIAFVSGNAWYRHYTAQGWTKIDGFRMNPDAPRYWTEIIPVATTNYYRLAISTTIDGTDFVDSGAGINSLQVSATNAGNLPGMIVQDNVSQPQFIFLSALGVPIVRTTQAFNEWSITFTDNTNTVVANLGDKREYVPIGNAMCWEDGVLYIASKNGEQIYRSVSGRPLDFVINVNSNLVTAAPYTQVPGGDAATTAYSVGVGGITCLRPMASGGIFVSASGANFLVTKNKTPGAPTVFGEYTFLRTFLFNASCLSDRTIIDTLGDTRFIGLTGIRSFNSILQTQNEGRNDVFSSKIQSAFGTDISPIVQDKTKAAAILYDNYELYAVQTIFGPAIAKYDTIGKCWTSFDILQTSGKAVKMFAKIELSIQRLFAITEDDQLYTLYIGPNPTQAAFRSAGVCSGILYENSNIRLANPKMEVKLNDCRVIINNVTQNCSCSFTPYVNNRLTPVGTQTKQITYTVPARIDASSSRLPDVNTNLVNLLYSTPSCSQGWKVFAVFTWTDGSFTQFSMQLTDVTPMNPLNSQGTTR